MKKRFKLILAIFISILILCVIGGVIWYCLYQNDKVPDNYIAVFNGGSGERTYSTYIYKIDNDHANYGFKYINTTNTTVSYGSSKVEIKITSRGTINYTDDVFIVAEKNNAYNYVLLPNGKKVSIEEFERMFLIN